MTEYINAFPGYEYKQLDDKKFHNMFRGIELGFGGWVYSEPGIYTNVALLDIASLHPSSIIALNKLGKYTQKYADLKQARVFIKHKDYESAKKLFDGRLAKYLDDPAQAKALSKALKLPLNSFFGVSFASFQNPARDSRDKNNIIALRGALFMKTLFDEVEARGFKIIAVRTDSIKIADATLDIIKFVQEFAQKYSYEMEHEGTYERICLIDKAQYIATFMRPEECLERYGYVPGDNQDHFAANDHPWTATGKEFQRGYIFKSLFSGEPITFDDCCETNTVKNGEIYFDFNEGLPNVEDYEKEQSRRKHNLEETNKRPLKLNPKFANLSDDDISAEIAKGHNYHFVGRVGRFYPIAPGKGGGELLVFRNGKYDSVSGAKGYRWMEAEVVKATGKEADIDPKYHRDQLDEAIAAINQFGDFDRFVDTTKPYICEEKPIQTPGLPFPDPPINKDPDDDERAPWEDLPAVVPCGDCKYNNCMECPCCKDDICTRGYSLAVENGG